MNRKFVSRVILPILIIVELSFIFLTWMSYSNKDITEIKETTEVNKEMFSMYVENKDGEYEEYTDSEIFPIGIKYYFNLERSNCIDNKGKTVTDVLTYNNNKITVSSNKTLFCYLYFDLDKVAPQTFTFYLGGSSNPEYITSTSTTAYLSWSDNDITSYCINTENNSGSCSWIDTSGNEVSVSYTISTQGSQIRYAFIRDAAENISPVVSDNVFLDSVAPVITSASDSGAGTANVTVTETGSGVTHVCVNTSSTSTTGCTWDEVSGTTFTSTTAVTATGSYYIHVKDKAGNIGHRTSAISITKPVPSLYTLCSSYTNMGTCMASEYGSSKLKEIANMSTAKYGDMYRYQGTYDVVDNNYVCFGTNNKSTCTSNTDAYMYRIIGVNSSGQIKLIKKEALNSSTYWHNDTANVSWPNSLVYSLINGSSFLTNTTYVPSGWESKISAIEWKYGSHYNSSYSYYEQYAYDGNTIYNIEKAWTNKVTSKVALWYISDYFYAYLGGVPGDYSNAQLAWIHLDDNDSARPSRHEWFIMGGQSGRAWAVMHNGIISNSSYQTIQGSIRPTFYLTSDVAIIGGTGTSTDPYIIN